MSDHQSFMPISMATLLPSAMLGIDVYVRSAPGLASAKLFASEEPVCRDKLLEYADAGVTRAFIDVEDRHKYQSYLQRNLHLLIEDGQTPLKSRLEVLDNVFRGVIDKQLQSGDLQNLIITSNQLAEATVRLFSTTEVTLRELCAALHHDYRIFTHSVNVAYYAVLLARQLGYDEAQQREVAVGAFLHDIGKMEIDAKVLNKHGPLNLQEVHAMKRHPITGLEKLATRDDVSFGQLMMTYQHHERCDGSGYPCAIPSDLIHPYGRLCAIVDVFEALTSQRPHRKPMELEKAMEFLTSRRGTEFDADMLDIWIELSNNAEVSHE